MILYQLILEMLKFLNVVGLLNVHDKNGICGKDMKLPD